jgi:hypothetical protein
MTLLEVSCFLRCADHVQSRETGGRLAQYWPRRSRGMRYRQDAIGCANRCKNYLVRSSGRITANEELEIKKLPNPKRRSRRTDEITGHR